MLIFTSERSTNASMTSASSARVSATPATGSSTRGVDPTMRAVDIIRKKREGHPLTVAEIDWMMEGIGHNVHVYQWSALLMAILWRGMSDHETAALTDAMMRSGSVVDLSYTHGLKVDKHRTAGGGDER